MPRRDAKPSGTPKTRRSLARKKKNKVQKQSVMRMIATMEATPQNINSNAPSTAQQMPPTPEDQLVTPAEEEFLQTGRTGRRNALPDILDSSKAAVSSSDLPARLESLSTSDTTKPESSGGTS